MTHHFAARYAAFSDESGKVAIMGGSGHGAGQAVVLGMIV
jgi:hypothetical protein